MFLPKYLHCAFCDRLRVVNDCAQCTEEEKKCQKMNSGCFQCFETVEIPAKTLPQGLNTSLSRICNHISDRSAVGSKRRTLRQGENGRPSCLTGWKGLAAAREILMSDWLERALGMEGRTFVSEFCLRTSEMRSLCSNGRQAYTQTLSVGKVWLHPTMTWPRGLKSMSRAAVSFLLSSEGGFSGLRQNRLYERFLNLEKTPTLVRVFCYIIHPIVWRPKTRRNHAR